MIPVKLSFKGLYSYQDELQTIEFGPLIEAGLFGIFGAVGSGKSSVLEAITMAVYGESERLNKKDERNYNMMNLKSNELLIDFEFVNFDQKKYRFACTSKRSGKHHNKVDTYQRNAYVLEGEEWITLGHANGEEVTGLSYDNFKRTVIIPQGKFQEFLELTSSSRSKMLKDLFKLDKYDLGLQANSLLKTCQSELAYLKGQWSGYESVNSEQKEQREQELTLIKTQIQQGQLEMEALKKQLREEDIIQEWTEALNERLSQWSKAQEQLTYYQDIQRRVELYRNTHKIFSNDLNLWKESQRELLAMEEDLKLLRKEEKLASEKNNELQTRYDDLVAKCDLHQGLKEKISFAKREARIFELNHGIEVQRKRLIKGEDAYSSLKQTIEEIALSAEKHRKEVQNYRLQLKDRESWIQLRNDWIRRLDLLKRKEALSVKIKTLKEGMAVTKTHLLNRSNEVVGFDLGQESTLVSEGLISQLAQVKTEMKAKQAMLHHVMVMQKMSEFADDLSEGQPCPLCGSTSHPAIADFQASAQEAEELKEVLRKLEVKEKSLTGLILEWEQWEKETKRRMQEGQSLEEDLKSLSLEEEKIKKLLDIHQSQFPSLEILEVRLAESEAMMVKLEGLEKEVEEKLSQEKQHRSRLEVFKTELTKIQQTIDRLEGEKLGQEREVLAEVVVDEKISDGESWMKYATTLSDQLSREEGEYKIIQKEREEFLQKYHQLSARLEAMEEVFVKRNIQHKGLKEAIDKKVALSEFESIDEVQKILAESWDVDEEIKKIDNYYKELHGLKVGIEDLRSRLGDRVFDADQYALRKKALVDMEVKMSEANERKALLQENIQRLSRQLAEKENLAKDIAEKQLREDNLKVLTGLFRGNGFVDFVSTIYLQEIVEIANRRFRILTHNHFALELSEDNNFYVRDYLNEGHLRSVKTLSGGQTFQASLCLALAMAETLQQQNQSYQNFFFLDEGFGTLDQSSLDLVFETLKSLRKEGRVVGVISHVESLKDEIDRYLRIVNHAEGGSKIYAHV
ncbi:SbcC/MukB-like Walker B domain-containing protein [Membranihabitans marinus]|uniref:SbcC/MukB-like Walker B domain-containing protein n=1 Tax=Membranihabitans marinus TaxID=1227546 RepID=UPI001F1F500E|nr:SMC family ATPase [Membranihabitans marinus]